MSLTTPQSAALYDALAPFYDDWQSAGGTFPFSTLVLDKLEPALKRWGPVSSFLDLGCGTGELLLALRRLHPTWRLVGADASPAMLAVARGKESGGEAITWLATELGKPLSPPLDAVGAFYDTLNHLPDLPALADAVAAVTATLRPGGVFVFDITNRLGFEKWWRSRNHWSGPGWDITVETGFRATEGTAHADVTVVRDGVPTRAHLIERCFSEADLRETLRQAGLVAEVVEPWCPFAIDAPGKTWWVARKSAREPGVSP